VDSLAARAPIRGALVAIAAAVAVALAGAPQAHAAACTTSWTGTGGPWNNPASWDNGVPDSSDVACIQKDGDYQIDIIPEDGAAANGTAVAKELHLGASSGTQTLEIQGRALTDLTEHDASLTLAGGAGSASDINSHGVINVDAGTAGTGTLCAVSPLTNGGKIATGGGNDSDPRILGGDITNQATLTMGIDTTVPSSGCGTGVSTLRNSGGTVTAGGGHTLNVAGTYSQSSGTTSLTSAHMTVGGTLTMTGGSFTGNPPVVGFLGDLSASGGSGTFNMQGASSLDSDVGPNVTVNLEGTAAEHASVGTTGGAGTNQGTINLTSLDPSHGALLTANDALTNTGTIATLPGAGGIRNLGGTIDNQGALSIGAINSGAEFGTDLDLTNTGALSIAGGGKLTLDDDNLTQSGGTLTVDGTLDYGNRTLILSGGKLNGTGTVKAATLANAAEVHPGASPGILAVDGDYTQTSAGKLGIEVQGATPGSEFSHLAVTGNAVLGGTLEVTTTGSQSGPLQILQAQQVTGAFATTNFVGQNWAVVTSTNGVTLIGPPVNSTKPSTSGVPRVGNTLTCNKGIWVPQGSPFTFTYSWRRDGVPLAATTAKRKVAAADQGHKLTCRVGATNGAGTTFATSNPTKSVPREPVQRGIFTKLNLRAGKAGAVRVPVRNPNPLATAGVLTLRNAKGKVVGQTKFPIAARTTKGVKVLLAPATFAKLTAQGQLKLAATLVLKRGAVKRTAKATLTVKPPLP
jgi:hypothetical protein